jgi:hypothetical protein
VGLKKREKQTHLKLNIMSDLSTYTERDAFNETLYNVVEEYLNEKDAHPTETVLAINR